MNQTHASLEFHIIRQQLADLAVTQYAKNALLSLEPSLREADCRRRMEETTEARRMLEALGTPPVGPTDPTRDLLDRCKKEGLLTPAGLNRIEAFLTACARMKSYLKRGGDTAPRLSGWGGALDPISALRDEITRCIRGEAVDTHASPALRQVRSKIEHAAEQVQSQLASVLRSKKAWLSDAAVVLRQGRYAVPVKKEHKNQFPGRVVDISGSGATVFMEPDAVVRLQEEIGFLEIEEENEVRRILYSLTALVEEHETQLSLNMEAMEKLDLLFAKARLSQQMDAVPVQLTTGRRIDLRRARHPLLDPEKCVPVDFLLEPPTRGVVITGPNTGGKTVVLKTVGLLSLMAQSGLHVPADPDSVLAMHSQVLCDIGDGQSITENLSTFSAHMTAIIAILDKVNPESLVLLDELGSGTDPAEGMGIAVAVLEELRRRGCMLVATTHYPEVKGYARDAQGLVNAGMAFDHETLRPLYRLELGKAGESCALLIAKRLGLGDGVLARAQAWAYGQTETLTEEKPRQMGGPKIEKIKEERVNPAAAFVLGDSVMVHPQKQSGIVFHAANDRGEVGVQIQGVKQWIVYKRLKLIAPASQLYPPDYDFSVIFDSVEARKASRKMSKGHRPDLEIVHEKDSWRE